MLCLPRILSAQRHPGLHGFGRFFPTLAPVGPADYRRALPTTGSLTISDSALPASRLVSRVDWPTQEGQCSQPPGVAPSKWPPEPPHVPRRQLLPKRTPIAMPIRARPKATNADKKNCIVKISPSSHSPNEPCRRGNRRASRCPIVGKSDERSKGSPGSRARHGRTGSLATGIRD